MPSWSLQPVDESPTYWNLVPLKYGELTLRYSDNKLSHNYSPMFTSYLKASFWFAFFNLFIFLLLCLYLNFQSSSSSSLSFTVFSHISPAKCHTKTHFAIPQWGFCFFSILKMLEDFSLMFSEVNFVMRGDREKAVVVSLLLPFFPSLESPLPPFIFQFQKPPSWSILLQVSFLGSKGYKEAAICQGENCPMKEKAFTHRHTQSQTEPWPPC